MKNLYTFLLLVCTLFIYSCEQDGLAAEAANDTGVGGSYARFIVVGDFMYIVDDSSIKTFDLVDPTTPTEIDNQAIGERIESIFHFDSRLFIGSGAGLFIYQIEEDGRPSQLSATPYFEAWDLFSCDPVVANDSLAFVTLNAISRVNRCGGSFEIETNLLKIFDIKDLSQPELIVEYEMTAPKGVGLDGETLFICDDTDGLKIFDVSDPLNIQLIKHFDHFTAFDVIPLDGLLLVVGPDNVYQFDYSNLEDIVQIALIPYGS